MDDNEEIIISIRLKISSVDHPQLTQYLKSEPNQMRRTRKLCHMASLGLVSGTGMNKLSTMKIDAPKVITEPPFKSKSLTEKGLEILYKCIFKIINRKSDKI